MPESRFERLIFALLTVIVTVHAYVFYSLYVVNGQTLMAVNGAASVMEALRLQGGVYMMGRMLPIWAVVLVEFACAYALEVFVGSPMSFRLAARAFDPATTHPVLFESAIICATVGIMCPAMSLIAAALYYPYYQGFSIAALAAMWVKLVCVNFPFAFFSQLFFIQPLVRRVFRALMRPSRGAKA